MSDNELASSADEGSDAEKAEALNAKVQRVMAPLMKKMTPPVPSPPPQPHSTGTPWSRRRQVIGHAAGEMGDGDYASTVPILPAATQSLRPLVGSPRG